MERSSLLTRERTPTVTSTNQRTYTPWRAFGLVGVFFGLVALTLSIIAFGRSDDLLSWVRKHTNTNQTHHHVIVINSLAAAGCSLCDDINATSTFDQAIFENGTWRARDKCRRVSDVQYFGAGTTHEFLASNTERHLFNDLFCDTLIIATNATLITRGFRIIVRHRLVLNGTIDNSGALNNDYVDSTLGNRSLPSYPPPLPPANTLNTGNSFVFNAVRYTAALNGTSANFVSPFCNIVQNTVIAGDIRTTSVTVLVSSIDNALRAVDLNGDLITAGAFGCPILHIDQNIADGTVTQRVSPGGIGGGVIVISAHSIEFGPNARVLSGGGEATITDDVSQRIVQSNEAYLVLNQPCEADDVGHYWIIQSPGTGGGAGFVVFISAQEFNISEILRVTRTGVVRMTSQLSGPIPPMAFRCNTSGYIDRASPLYIKATYPQTLGGIIILHDVCNNRPEVLYDNIDNDLDSIVDRVDLDLDGLQSCKPGESHINESNSALACDCNDQNSLTGDILNDARHCGTCNTVCGTTQVCRRGMCLPFCSVVNVFASWFTSSSAVVSWNNFTTTGLNATLRLTITSDNFNVTSISVPTISLRFNRLARPASQQNATAIIANTISHNCGNISTFASTSRATNSDPFQLAMGSVFGTPFNGLTCHVLLPVTFVADPSDRSPAPYLSPMRLALQYSYELYSVTPAGECAMTLLSSANPNIVLQTPALVTHIENWFG